jgi:hypothetical protein
MVLILLPVVAFFLVLLLGARLKPLVQSLSAKLPGRWAERVPRWYFQALQACFAFTELKRLAGVLALTAAAYCADYTAFFCFFRAFDWTLPVTAAMTVGVLLALGSLVPAAPGYVGIYQVACVLALVPYGIGESSALAYSIVAQGATILVIGLLGLSVGAQYGVRFGLTKGAE